MILNISYKYDSLANLNSSFHFKTFQTYCFCMTFLCFLPTFSTLVIGNILLLKLLRVFSLAVGNNPTWFREDPF